MAREKNTSTGSVNVSVELDGEYQEVVDIIGGKSERSEDFDRIVGDFTIVIETVESINGGTKSQIADALPENVSIDISSENIVDVLRVLERYGFVTLDQNTWKPGSGSSTTDHSKR